MFYLFFCFALFCFHKRQTALSVQECDSSWNKVGFTLIIHPQCPSGYNTEHEKYVTLINFESTIFYKPLNYD